MNEYFVTLSTILVLTTGWVQCGDKVSAGCYDASKGTITVSTKLTGDQFKEVVLHEVAHAKFNTRDVSMFDNYPARDNRNTKAIEKMADWFVIFWKNLSLYEPVGQLASFFLTGITYAK